MVLKQKKEEESTVEYIGLAFVALLVAGLFWWLARLVSRTKRNKGRLHGNPDDSPP